MISQATLERINQVTSIVEVVGRFVKLKKSGDNHVGKCPFHTEKTGSFSVSESKKIYKCFGCGKSGDVIQFLIEHEKKTYPEAIQWLCQLYRIPVDMKERTYSKPLPRLEKLSTKAINWFEKERKISNNTLLRLNITECVEWMPQFNKEVKVICFNYYRDGELVNIKFRGPQKSFKLAKDAELIFYNIDAIKDEDTAIIVEGECLPVGTQVFTEEGWINIEDYKGQKIAEYKDGYLTMVKPIAYIKKRYDNDLITLSNQLRYFTSVTKNHTLIIEKEGVSKKITASELNTSQYSIPRVGLLDGPGVPFSDDQLRLCVAVSADFTIRKEGDVCGAIKKERKITRFGWLLDRMGIRYTQRTDKKGYQSFYISRTNAPAYLFKEFPKQWIPLLSLHQRRLLIHEMVYWDGNLVPFRRQVEYSSALYTNAVFMQTVAHTAGYTSTIIPRKNKFGKWYKCSILFEKTHTSCQRLKKENTPYAGDVYCFQTTSGAFLIRQNECISITGNCDVLATYESHIYNVVSVPNGAGTGNLKLEYLDNCWHLFEGKKKIILATDDDEPGRALREELGRRLGKERCWRVEYPAGCKDLNAVLIDHGTTAVAQILENAREWPLEGIIPMDLMFPTLEEYYKNGYPRGAKAGIRGLDHLLTFAPGQLTMITGIPSHGKDEYTNWIMAMLAMNEEWSWGVCGFEEPAPIQTTKIIEKLVGKAFDYRKHPEHRMSRQDYEFGVYMIDKYFNFIDMQQVDANIDSILKWAEVLVRRKGIKGLIINPWNCLEHKIPPGSSETAYISEVLTKLINFLVRFGVHGLLIAHPTKMLKNPKTNKYEVPTLYHISGSANFYNKTHNGLCIYRDFESNVVDVYIQKVKWSWLGRVGFSTYSYDTNIRQYSFLSSSINPE